MGKIAKEQRRRLRLWMRGMRQSVADRTPAWARRVLDPVVHYSDLMLVDHGFFRVAYLNRHKLGSAAWRSAQPAPYQIARMRRLGIRTIINLRGPRHCGSYWLEQSACARHGIRLVDFQLRSRAAPTKAELLGARDVLQGIEYPLLIHCKSGADRAGLMSALYMIVRENVPVAEAKQQLSIKYGHIRQSDTGILDYFFDRYLADNAANPIEFFDWVEQRYDPDELKTSFAAKAWANVLVNRVLKRE
jgi:protein tyrosine/serine phosphatase